MEDFIIPAVHERERERLAAERLRERRGLYCGELRRSLRIGDRERERPRSP
uniref:Transcriptional regulator n=1 Tax=Heterorhabditis bacteriophora TaxID=37862 RepID=A0A1I7XB08_HETBA